MFSKRMIIFLNFVFVILVLINSFLFFDYSKVNTIYKFSLYYVFIYIFYLFLYVFFKKAYYQNKLILAIKSKDINKVNFLLKEYKSLEIVNYENLDYFLKLKDTYSRYCFNKEIFDSFFKEYSHLFNKEHISSINGIFEISDANTIEQAVREKNYKLFDILLKIKLFNEKK